MNPENPAGQPAPNTQSPQTYGIPQNPVAPPAVLPEEPKKNKFAKLLLTIVLIIAVLFIAAYAGMYIFAQEQLNSLLGIAKPTPTLAPTIAPSPTPIPDPTANWKIYTNDTHKFSLHYPGDWEPVDKDDDAQYIMRPLSKDVADEINNDTFNGKMSEDSKMTFNGEVEEGIFIRVFENSNNQTATDAAKEMHSAETHKYLKDANLPGIDAVILEDHPDPTNNKFGPALFVVNEDKLIWISSWIDDNNNQTINRVFQSFTFSEPVSAISPSQPQVACTADAKICPDGSSVGRVPPDCEFAAC